MHQTTYKKICHPYKYLLILITLHLFPILLCLVLSHVQLCNCMHCSLPDSSIHRDSPGKNTGVGCHFLLQGIFPIQG